MKPLATFKVFTDRKRGRACGPFYRVLVFETAEAMRAYATKHNVQGRTARYFQNAGGFCSSYKHYQACNGKAVRTPDSGMILLHCGELGAGVVAHEMTHAAFYYLLNWRPQLHRRLQTSVKADELLAWVNGWLVTQFWRGWYKRFPHHKPKPAEAPRA